MSFELISQGEQDARSEDTPKEIWQRRENPRQAGTYQLKRRCRVSSGSEKYSEGYYELRDNSTKPLPVAYKDSDVVVEFPAKDVVAIWLHYKGMGNDHHVTTWWLSYDDEKGPTKP